MSILSKSRLDEFEREFKANIGTETDLNPQRFLVEATRDNIKNFAEAVGDNNPLWINEEYARKSRFGGVIAPPTFLYNVNHGTTPAIWAPGVSPSKDLALLYAGAELEFSPSTAGWYLAVRPTISWSRELPFHLESPSGCALDEDVECRRVAVHGSRLLSPRLRAEVGMRF